MGLHVNEPYLREEEEDKKKKKKNPNNNSNNNNKNINKRRSIFHMFVVESL